MTQTKPQKPVYVFDTLGTTLPPEEVENLRKAMWEYGTMFASAAEIEELRALSENDPHSEAFRQYLRRSGPIQTRILESGLYVVTFYPDARPALEKVRAYGADSRIFSKGTPELMKAIYEQGGLLGLLAGMTSATVDLKGDGVGDKTNPLAYIALEQQVMTPNGERLMAYTSDDAREVNAFGEAFEAARADAFYIERGQKITAPLAERVRVIKDLRDVIG